MTYIQKELFERYHVKHLDATNLQALINIMPEESPHDFDRVLQEAQRRGFFYFRKKIIPIDHEVYAGDRGSIRVTNIFTPPEDYIRTSTFPTWDEINEALSFKLDTSTFLTFEEMINRQLQSKASKQDLNTKLNISDFEVFQTGNLEALRAKMDVSTFDQFKDTLHRVAFTGAYSDLTGAPAPLELAAVATTGSYNDLLDRPSFATVATSGKYSDLIEAPAFPDLTVFVNKAGDTMTGPLKAPSIELVGQGTQNEGKALVDEYSVRHWVTVPNGSDLNNYVNNGKYGISSNSAASTIANTPVNTAGWLEVQSLRNFDVIPGDIDATWQNILQTYTTLSGQRFERTISSNGSGVWTYGGWNTTRIALDIYPVGAVYISVNNTNPSTLFGGTWVLFGQGQTLVGQNTSDADFNALLKTGGHKSLQAHTHTATTSITANGAHTHTVSGTAASAGSHSHGLYAGNSGGTSNSPNGNNYAAHSGSNKTFGYSIPMDSSGAHTHSVSGTAASAGSHGHTASTSIGSSGGGNSQNLQPYIVVNFWRRTG